MRRIFEEYGSVLITGFVGILCFAFLSIVLNIQLNGILITSTVTPTQNENMLHNAVPTIQVENKRTKLGEVVDLKKDVIANDGVGNNISDKVFAFSDVDFNTKGRYLIRYEVENDVGRKAYKKAYIIVD